MNKIKGGTCPHSKYAPHEIFLGGNSATDENISAPFNSLKTWNLPLIKIFLPPPPPNSMKMYLPLIIYLFEYKDENAHIFAFVGNF